MPTTDKRPSGSGSGKLVRVVVYLTCLFVCLYMCMCVPAELCMEKLEVPASSLLRVTSSSVLPENLNNWLG